MQSIVPTSRDANPSDVDATLSAEDAARFLCLAPKTLAQWRWDDRKKGVAQRIPFTQVGRRVLYYLRDLRTFKAKNYTGSSKVAA